MIETDFLDAVRNKNQENCKIGNRKRSAMPYSAVVLPWYSILFYLVQVIRIECKNGSETLQSGNREGKNESSVHRQYAELKSGRNNDPEREMRLRS